MLLERQAKFVALLFVLGGFLPAVAQSTLQVGYATISSPGALPVTTALFSYSNTDGVLVSQAAVDSVKPTRAGEIFVDQSGADTGIAMVEASGKGAAVTLVLRSSDGTEIARKSQTLGPGEHVSQFLKEIFALSPGFTGTLTFDSDQPVGAIALRQSTNAYGEPLYATLPVVDRSIGILSRAIVFPHLAVGPDYSTQLLLMNPTAQPLGGRISLVSSGGQPLDARVDGQQPLELSYQLKAYGAFRVELTGENPEVGYAVVTPDPNTVSPAGTAIFRVITNGHVVTEAAAAATESTTAARIFVDQAGSRTGLALANSSNLPATIECTLMDTSGGAESVQSLTLSAGTHRSVFVDELFPEVTAGFTGLLELRSSVPIAPITLKLTTNTRGDSIFTTLPVADLTRPTEGLVVIPQIAIGAGFSMRLVIITTNTNPGDVRFSFFDSNSAPMVIPMSGLTGSQFTYHFTAGSARQLNPGLNGTALRIVALDPSDNQPVDEITINKGNTLLPRVRAIDSLGRIRDDFDITIQSLDTGVAEIVGARIHGKTEGFSTLTMTAGDAIGLATATVVAIQSAASGYEVTGVVLDSTKRLYLTIPSEHTVLRAQSLTQRPELYAGITAQPGLKNDIRNQALFRNPGFIALDQASGVLYVSDTANHVIRKVNPGADGRVETLAGTGISGIKDGPADQASFNKPQGITLDNLGNLYVADTGNHVIRRIRLTTPMVVETIAGSPGQPGFIDGKGGEARFNLPAGIAIETETLAQELERQRSGSPAPPTHILVADTGNGVIRRVVQDGDVSTLSAPGEAQRRVFLKTHSASSRDDTGIRFAGPTGVAVDAIGNIYVTEPSSGQVRIVLVDGRTASAGQPKSFSSPRAAVITSSGTLVVASSDAAKEIKHGEPQITSIQPDHVGEHGGQVVTIFGGNFSPETRVFIFGVTISDVRVLNSRTITFTMPPAPSGKATVTVQTRGGIAQKALSIAPPSLSTLQPGYVTTYAGGSTYLGDGSPATSAATAFPWSISLDSAGNLYIADRVNYRVRKVAFGTGVITTVAGSGTFGYSGDNGPAAVAALSEPWGIAIDAGGNLLIADMENHRIRKVQAGTGVITTIVGNGNGQSEQCGGTFSGDGGPAILAGLNSPYGLAVDKPGNIFIADECNSRIRRVDAQTGIITTVAGNGVRGFSGDGGPATKAELNSAGGLATDTEGNLYIADVRNLRVRKVDVTTGLISSVAFTGVLNAVGFDQSENMLIAAPGMLQRIDRQTQTATTIATGGDLRSVAVDGAGVVFVADASGNTVMKVDGSTMTTVAGNGKAIVAEDGRPATDAAACAISLAQSSSALYFGDQCLHQIRRIDRRTGIITTVGNGNFDRPIGIAIDPSENLFVFDDGAHFVRRIDASTGTVTTVAGNGQATSSGDNGPATLASVSFGRGITIDPSGNLFLTEQGVNGKDRLRRIDAGTGTITTVATLNSLRNPIADGNGNVLVSYFTDQLVAHISRVNPTTGAITDILTGWQANCLTMDTSGRIFLCTSANQIAEVVPQKGVTILSGSPTVCSNSNDGIPISSASVVAGPMQFDAEGNLFFIDACLTQNRIRVVRGPIP